jgi:pyruvate/2-oxoglutarate dehydrogenase complex dihydrolipoamide acyltransferase (E2) component|tara:strand:- start:310 stop:549 length:240 start_codon:yes stop_codon:yes gene_type:complete
MWDNVDIIVPKLYEDMQGGVLVEWFKEVGDEIESGDEIFSIETEKTVFEIEAEDDGKITAILVGGGNKVKTLDVVGTLE